MGRSGLIRAWIEQRRDGAVGVDNADIAARVERLERAVFTDKRAS